MPRDWVLDPKKFQKWARHALNPGRRAPDRGYAHWLGKKRLTAEPQINMLTDTRGNIAVDFIGRFENVVEDFEVVLTKLDQTRPLPPRKYWMMPKLNVSQGIDPRWPKEHYSFYYDDQTIEKVWKVYADDIKHFGYTYEDY